MHILACFNNLKKVYHGSNNKLRSKNVKCYLINIFYWLILDNHYYIILIFISFCNSKPSQHHCYVIESN